MVQDLDSPIPPSFPAASPTTSQPTSKIKLYPLPGTAVLSSGCTLEQPEKRLKYATGRPFSRPIRLEPLRLELSHIFFLSTARFRSSWHDFLNPHQFTLPCLCSRCLPCLEHACPPRSCRYVLNCWHPAQPPPEGSNPDIPTLTHRKGRSFSLPAISFHTLYYSRSHSLFYNLFTQSPNQQWTPGGKKSPLCLLLLSARAWHIDEFQGLFTKWKANKVTLVGLKFWQRAMRAFKEELSTLWAARREEMKREWGGELKGLRDGCDGGGRAGTG